MSSAVCAGRKFETSETETAAGGSVTGLLANRLPPNHRANRTHRDRQTGGFRMWSRKRADLKDSEGAPNRSQKERYSVRTIATCKGSDLPTVYRNVSLLVSHPPQKYHQNAFNPIRHTITKCISVHHSLKRAIVFSQFCQPLAAYKVRRHYSYIFIHSITAVKKITSNFPVVTEDIVICSSYKITTGTYFFNSFDYLQILVVK